MNPEIDKELQKCVMQLRNKGVAIIPSETGWSVTTDLSNKELISEIISDENYCYPVVLLKEAGQLQKYVAEIPDAVYDLIEFSNRPLHFTTDKILNTPYLVPGNGAPVAFRVAKDEFTYQLLYKYGKPLFAINILSNERPALQDVPLKNNSYIVNLRNSSKSITSELVIIKFLPGGQFEFLKK